MFTWPRIESFSQYKCYVAVLITLKYTKTLAFWIKNISGLTVVVKSNNFLIIFHTILWRKNYYENDSISVYSKLDPKYLNSFLGHVNNVSFHFDCKTSSPLFAPFFFALVWRVFKMWNNAKFGNSSWLALFVQISWLSPVKSHVAICEGWLILWTDLTFLKINQGCQKTSSEL